MEEALIEAFSTPMARDPIVLDARSGLPNSPSRPSTASSGRSSSPMTTATSATATPIAIPKSQATAATAATPTHSSVASTSASDGSRRRSLADVVKAATAFLSFSHSSISSSSTSQQKQPRHAPSSSSFFSFSMSDPDLLMKSGLNSSSSLDISPAQMALSESPTSNGDDNRASLSKRVYVDIKLKGRHEETAPVMDQNLAKLLQPHLPPMQRESSAWNMIYSMDQHGVSLSTLLRKCEGKEGPCLLCIKDSKGIRFGAFLSDMIERHADGSSYGNGSCFLWTDAGGGGRGSTANMSGSPGADIFQLDEDVYIFKATGKNDLFMMYMTHPHAFAVGVSDGVFGLLIDDSFDHCQSGHCATFDNSRLSGDPQFFPVGVEVWTFEF